VNTAEIATPLALVVALFAPPANVPLAPVCGGAVNVTVTPLIPVPFDVTVATSGFAKATLTTPFWPPPLVAVIAMVGAVAEPEPQLVRKLMARKIEARILA
jgi:hypothetical protein